MRKWGLCAFPSHNDGGHSWFAFTLVKKPSIFWLGIITRLRLETISGARWNYFCFRKRFRGKTKKSQTSMKDSKNNKLQYKKSAINIFNSDRVTQIWSGHLRWFVKGGKYLRQVDGVRLRVGLSSHFHKLSKNFWIPDKHVVLKVKSCNFLEIEQVY